MVELEEQGPEWRKSVQRQRWHELKAFHKAVMEAAARPGAVHAPEAVVRRLEQLRAPEAQPGQLRKAATPVAAFVKKIKDHILNV
jgi:hypothetical protein